MLVRKNQKTCTGRSFAKFEGVRIKTVETDYIRGGQGETVNGGVVIVITE